MEMLRNRYLWKDSEGVATIIIVACSVLVCVAAAYLILGLSSAFTRYDRLEFTSGYAVSQEDSFTIEIKVKNTGSSALHLDQVFLNGKPVDDYGDTVEVSLSGTIEPGQDLSGTIILAKGEEWKPSMTVEVMIRTENGGEYPKTVVLPY